MLTVTVAVLAVAHIAEVGVWAIFYEIAGVSAKIDVHPFEFAFENYAALGYGDAVPVSGKRLYAPLTALNGLLLIGWSVAIIFEVMRMAEFQIKRGRKRAR